MSDQALAIEHPTTAATPPTDRKAGADARFWDRIAQKYAADPIADMAGYERSMRRTAALLGEDHRVLEVGCGTGTSALRLAERTGSILATDISGAMIAIARQKAAHAGCGNVRFEVAGVDDTLDAHPPYDAVLAFNILHLVPDLDRALATLYDRLKPSGVLISKTACLGAMNPLIRWVAVPVMQAFGKAPHVLSFTVEGLESAIARAGFQIEKREFHATKGKDTRPFIVARKV